MEDEMMEAEKLLRWFDAERKNGLVDLKFFPVQNAGITLEQVCADVNGLVGTETDPKRHISVDSDAQLS